MKRFVIYVVLISLITACENTDFLGMIGFSTGVDSRFADSEKLIPSSGISHTVFSNEEDYCFYLFGDLHTYNTTKNLDTMVESFLRDGRNVVMTLCLGDLNSGHDQYELNKKHFEPLGPNLFITPGNHDLYFNEWPNYLKYFGGGSYLVEVITPSGKKDLYISLDTASGYVGGKQMSWLEDNVLKGKVAGGAYRHVVVFTHNCIIVTNITDAITGPLPEEETYALAKLFSDYGIDLVLSGHHHVENENVFKGVQYHVLDPLKDEHVRAAYYIYSVSDTFSYSKICLN